MQNNVYKCISNHFYRLAFTLESRSKQNKDERMEQNESREQNESSEQNKSIELKQHESDCQNEVVDKEVTAPHELPPR